MSPSTWTISELAREFDVTPRTIRFYEDQGIVSPAREGATASSVRVTARG